MLKFVKHFFISSNCLDLYHIKRLMARNKQYNEQEVIEKAMSLFWRNGYQNTSVRMLKRRWASINFLFMQVLETNMAFS
jgi:hypothetical protein